MKTRIIILAALAAVLAPAVALAQIVDAGIVDMVSDMSAAITSIAPVTDLNGLIQVINLIQSADPIARRLGCAAALAFGLRGLVQLLKRLSLSDNYMRRMPLILAGISAITVLADKVGLGSTWTQAIILGGGPLGAVVVNEILSRLPGKKVLS